MSSRDKYLPHSPIFHSPLNPSPQPRGSISPLSEYLQRRRGLRRWRSVSLGEMFLRTKGQKEWRMIRLLEYMEQNDETEVEIYDGNGGWVAYNPPSSQEIDDKSTLMSTEVDTVDELLPDSVSAYEEYRTDDHEPDDDGWQDSVASSSSPESMEQEDTQGASASGSNYTSSVPEGPFRNARNAHDIHTARIYDDVDEEDVTVEGFVVIGPLQLLATSVRTNGSGHKKGTNLITPNSENIQTGGSQDTTNHHPDPELRLEATGPPLIFGESY